MKHIVAGGNCRWKRRRPGVRWKIGGRGHLSSRDVAGNWQAPRTDVKQPAGDRLQPGRLRPSLAGSDRRRPAGRPVDGPSINLTPAAAVAVAVVVGRAMRCRGGRGSGGLTTRRRYTSTNFINSDVAVRAVRVVVAAAAEIDSYLRRTIARADRDAPAIHSSLPHVVADHLLSSAVAAPADMKPPRILHLCSSVPHFHAPYRHPAGCLQLTQLSVLHLLCVEKRQLTICFKSSKPIQIGLCMLMSLSIQLHAYILTPNMVRHDICRHSYAVERGLVVGFCR